MKKESQMIHVIAVVTAKPGRRAELIKELEAIIPLQRAEQGFAEVSLTMDADGTKDRFGDDAFVMIEKWERPRDVRGPFNYAAPSFLQRADKREGRQYCHPRTQRRGKELERWNTGVLAILVSSFLP
jgi:quinol monooxygenase YgiN